VRGAIAIVWLGVLGCHTSPVVLESGLAGATTIAVDSTSLYWIENGPATYPPSNVPVLLRRAPLHGGLPETIAAGIAGSRDLRLVDGQLYFSSFGAGQIFTVPPTGGVPRMVAAPGAGESLAAWAVQGADVFTIMDDRTSYHLRRMPLAGGASIELYAAADFQDIFRVRHPAYQLAVTPDAITWSTTSRSTRGLPRGSSGGRAATIRRCR